MEEQETTLATTPNIPQQKKKEIKPLSDEDILAITPNLYPPKKKGRKPLSDEEKALRRLEKHKKQKEFYQQNKKYFIMKYNSYLLDDRYSLEDVKRKFESCRLNYELLRDILIEKEKKILGYSNNTYPLI